MGSLAAARRTQSSYQTFLTSTNPSDLGITLQAPDITAVFSRLGDVRAVASSVYLNAFPLEGSGAPELLPVFDNDVTQEGSVNGEYFDQDRVTVTSGRMADPARPDEFVASALAAQLLGWHVGEVIPFGFYTNAQTEQQSFGSAKHPSLPSLRRTTHGNRPVQHRARNRRDQPLSGATAVHASSHQTARRGAAVRGVRPRTFVPERRLDRRARNNPGSPEDQLFLPRDLGGRGPGGPHRPTVVVCARRVRPHRATRRLDGLDARDRSPPRERLPREQSSSGPRRRESRCSRRPASWHRERSRTRFAARTWRRLRALTTLAARSGATGLPDTGARDRRSRIRGRLRSPRRPTRSDLVAARTAVDRYGAVTSGRGEAPPPGSAS